MKFRIDFRVNGLSERMQSASMRSAVIFLAAVFYAMSSVTSVRAQKQEGPRRGSQVVDDTTKQIYGPRTSKYFYEDDVFYNQIVLHQIDTTPRNFHRFTYVQQKEYTYQDLGNVGTAARPIFYQVPSYIGISSGFEAFDLYWDATKIRYFDTKSPYSNMKVSLGKGGRSLTNVTFSRNITPQWNFGFDYRGMFIDKQIQRRGKGDRNVRSTYYDIFSTFYTKDSTYRVFVNMARHMYEADEFGGVVHTISIDALDSIFLLNQQTELKNATSRELRIQFHLFHQYEVGRALQLYHKMDRYRQGNQFLNLPETETYKFDYVAVPGDTTSDRTTLRTFRNEVGVKGNVSKIFYNGYYAIRHYSMRYKYFTVDTLANGLINTPPLANEHYLGGRIALQLDSLMQLRGWVEKMLLTGGFRIEAQLASRWLDASLKQNQYAVPFIYQAYKGSHDIWINKFSDVQATQLNGYLHYRSKVLTVSPGLTFTTLKNYVYFYKDTLGDQDVLPRQSSGNQIIFAPELKISATLLKHITFKGNVIYNKMLENADQAIQVPDLFINSQLAYENIFFNGNLDMHAGVDLHWRSSYYALDYDPVIQQYFVQHSIKVNAFPIIDIFFNAKIKRGRIFLKYHNLLQTFTKEEGNNGYGYMPTPYYPGQRNVIDFGFDWSFYD